MELLEGVTRNYEWGSTSSIPSFLGRSEDGKPWAELWLGAHPSAPALLGAGQQRLDTVVAVDPVAALGPETTERFGSLPFLLKILAAAEPLSLQAHPSMVQAEAGYAREHAAGIALDAFNRSFRDRLHKPELICALSEFNALCGFREPDATRAVLETIDTHALDPIRARIDAEPNAAGLNKLLEYLLTLSASDANALVESVVVACGRPGPDEGAGERALAAALGARYPGDAGVVIALLLNRVTLQPGEALFLGPGNLHMYLNGTGVEIMANSDNVLRGGLTSKHVDIPSLLDVVDAQPIEPDVQRPAVIDGVALYETPVSEFSFARIEVDGSCTLAAGPAILICTDGSIDVGPHTLDRGTAAWLPAADGAIEAAGRGTVYRAGVGQVS
ncbi:MAG: mannose-6-phosphate isomerase, class I [Acidimicrobiales bacterium]|nr:mannose-6-phosphate isomerase, class I [Acidimicrobiales bacterium]MDG1875778.1 mannose-6-phosphate isomerase, class I [Acidimicrobiales bacterium]